MFNVGFPALDLIAAGDYGQPDEMYERYSLDPTRPILVFTQHSVATEYDSAADQVRPALAALVEAGDRWECQSIVTYPNDDAGGRRIMKEIDALRDRGLAHVQVHRSLGRYNYHGLLNVATACIGNSSSGIKETPAFHCPCINIGRRQQGRLRGDNVIDVGYDAAEIVAAIGKCMNDDEFKQRVGNGANPYGAGNAGPRIADTLATIDLDQKLVQKKMTF